MCKHKIEPDGNVIHHTRSAPAHSYALYWEGWRDNFISFRIYLIDFPFFPRKFYKEICMSSVSVRQGLKIKWCKSTFSRIITATTLCNSTVVSIHNWNQPWSYTGSLIAVTTPNFIEYSDTSFSYSSSEFTWRTPENSAFTGPSVNCGGTVLFTLTWEIHTQDHETLLTA